ncbi:MAG TPA: porin [Ignavibacteriaceae bacterium]
MNYKKHFVLIITISLLSILGVNELYAQDDKIPGGNQEVPLGVKERNGKLLFSSDNGDFQWWFDSRIQVDGAIYNENLNEMSNGIILRRATFALKAVLWKDWQAEFDMDFGEDVSVDNQTDWRDMWIKYTFPKFNLSLQVGNFKEPFGLERLGSSRMLTFMERSTVSGITLGRRMGGSARYWTNNWQVTAALMGHELGSRVDKGQQDEGWSTTLRLTAAPINNFGENLHLGIAGSYKIPDVTTELRPNTIEVSARTETYVFDPKLLHTGDINNVNYFNRYGFEFMYINGPFYFQSEFIGSSIYRWYGNPTVNLQGGYAMAAWVITGETRYYYVDEGEVGPIEKPKYSWGALEVAARYSVTNLNDFDTDIHGGQSNQLMLGINYYPNMNIKLQFNYSYVNLDEFATRKGNLYGNDDHSFIQMRVQASL